MFTLCCLEIEDKSDREFMVWLYQEHENLMFATARRYIQDTYDCEVIVQDSLVKLLSRVQQLRTYRPSVLTGYIVSTVKHTAIDHLRKAGREETHQITWPEEPMDQLQSGEPSVETILILKEQKDLLLRVWSQLPEVDQQLLEGKYIHGYSDEQLSGQFHCKASSIRMKLTRARRNALALMTAHINEMKDGERLQ